MIVIKLTPDIYRLAEERAHKMLSNGLYNRFDNSYRLRFENAKTGCIGEIAFEQYLKSKGIPYQIDVDFTDRRQDLFDFKIGNTTIDIKTAKTKKPPLPSWTYGYPTEQFAMEKDYIIVACYNPDVDLIRYWGYISHDEIGRCKKTNSNSFAAFEYSTENFEFKYSQMNGDIDSLLERINK